MSAPSLSYTIAASALPRKIRAALDWLTLATERSRTRHELLRLDDRSLRDIGITRREALTEARKPFWRS